MNPHIEECRELGLSILKPTQKQLKHGLELHRDALVWDSYGFIPGGYTQEAMNNAMALSEAGADRNEISDYLENENQLGFLATPDAGRLFKETFDAAGVDCVFQNSGEESNDIERLIKRLARRTYLSDKLRDVMTRAVFPSDVAAAKKAGKHTIYMDDKRGSASKHHLFRGKRAVLPHRFLSARGPYDAPDLQPSQSARGRLCGTVGRRAQRSGAHCHRGNEPCRHHSRRGRTPDSERVWKPRNVRKNRLSPATRSQERSANTIGEKPTRSSARSSGRAAMWASARFPNSIAERE